MVKFSIAFCWGSVVFLSLLLNSCDQPSASSEAHAKWEKVLSGYRVKGQEQQLRSAYFLIGNLANKASVLTVLHHDSLPNDVQLRDTDYLSLVARLSFAGEHTNSHWLAVKCVVPDSSRITTEQMTANINNAYKARSVYPWALATDEPTFNEYVLPYRIAVEEPEDWRTYFLQRYLHLADSLPVNANTSQVYRFIEHDITRLFQYTKNYNPVISSLTLKQLLYLKRGGCEEVAGLLVYALRSVGIPATVELVPLWGRSNFGHTELIYADSTGTMAPHRPNRFVDISAKVFRKMYTIQPNPAKEISKLGVLPENIPAFFDHDDLMDVTHLRTTVADVRMPLQYPGGREKAGYLCVYNAGTWKPVEWSQINHDTVLFKNMGTPILYHTAVYKQGEVVLTGEPFFLEKGGVVRPAATGINPPLITLVLERNGIDEWMDVKPGIRYVLSYWDTNEKRWKKLATNPCQKEKQIVFTNVPEGQLYKLEEVNRNNKERPFSYESGKQRWW